MENTIVKKLNTWLPLDVFEALTEFAKQNAGTALSKYDYGVAIRILLLKSMYADHLFELDERVSRLETKTQENQIPLGYKEIKTLKDTQSNNQKEVITNG